MNILCVYVPLTCITTESRKTTNKFGKVFTTYVIDKGLIIYIFFLTHINQ